VHSLHFQDKWQVSPRLTADLGLRWEYWPSSKPRFPGGFSNYNWTNNTIELAGIGSIPMDLGVESQPKSFAPRLGLAYRINSKTVIRAGFGMSYNTRFIANYGFPVRQQNTFNPPNTYTAAGSMAAGIPPPDFVVIPASGIIDPAPPTASVSVTKKDLPHSYVESWNIALQRSLPGNFAVEVTYVGNHVLNQQTGWNFNAASRLGGGTASQPFFARYGRSAAVNIDIGTHQYYDALQVKFDRRFSNGFMLTTAYTYSKSINFAPRQYFDLLRDKGRTNFDLTHVFTQAYVYDLPFGRSKRWGQSGPLRWALGDWQVNGLLLLQTGRPLNLAYSSTSLNAPGHNNQPDLAGAGKPEVYGKVGVGQLWFDTSRFAAPAPLTFGNVGRNILSGPGVANLDLSVFRRFKLTERFNLEFRAESFNFSNTPHFANPGTTFGSATFGQVTATEDFISSATDTDNRKIQFGLRLSF
ncbi:MAG: TonB-dependent receptor domain-containing protein, partial [Bryobacteraceae bacterium]